MASLSRAQLLAGSAAAVALAPRIVVAQALEKIRFTGVPTDDLTPIYYAMKNGLYAKAGLDVELVAASSGTAATTAVVSGTYEMGKGSLIASLLAHLRSLPLLIVANGALWDAKNPFTQILVATDAPYKTAADLNGKIASSAALNDLAQLGIVAWVDKNGGDAKTLRWVEIPNSAAGAALAEHRVDVGSLNEPQLAAALESGRVRVLAPNHFNAIAERFAITVYFANSDWAAKHGDAIKKWVRVTYDAAAYTNAHKAETAPAVADVTKIPLATIQKMTRVDGATSSDPGLIQPAIETAAKYKHIPRSFPAKEAYFNG